jgi:hypothetical protein
MPYVLVLGRRQYVGENSVAVGLGDMMGQAEVSLHHLKAVA